MGNRNSESIPYGTKDSTQTVQKDGTERKSLKDRGRWPRNSSRKQTKEKIRLVYRKAKKYKYQDHISAFQETRKEGYTRNYGCFLQNDTKTAGIETKAQKRRNGRMSNISAQIIGQKVQVDVKFVHSERVTDGNKYLQYTAADEHSRWMYRYVNNKQLQQVQLIFSPVSKGKSISDKTNTD